jgi:hypothetical protein
MIAVVIVNYRKPQLTRESVLSILRHAGQPAIIVVVDNSEDGGRSLDQLLACEWPAEAGVVTTLTRETNRLSNEAGLYFLPAPNKGFAAANNEAFRYLMKADHLELVLLLNNDAFLQPGSLLRAVQQFDARPMLGLLGFCVLEHHDPDRIQYVGGRYDYYTGRLTLCGQGQRYTREETDHHKIDYPSGAAMMVRMKALVQAGLMDETFFLYGEELDLSEKMRGHHWDVDYCYYATVTHIGAATLGQGSSGLSLLSDFYWLRSRWLLSKRHHYLAGLTFGFTSLLYPLRRMLAGQWKRVAMYFWIRRHPNLFFEDFIRQYGSN